MSANAENAREPVPTRSTWLWATIAPLVLWSVALLVVSPAGDFPLNDDWIYGSAVANWLETGHYTGHPFSTASLVFQAGWGRLFCLIFGFSFEVLRWSTLVLWAVAALATGQMARIAGAGRWASALVGCLVIANPLAFNLGYSFMTDVPFMALMALAGYGYLRAMNGGALRWLLMGSVFGACALLTRQFAPLILVAFLFACSPSWKSWRQRENVARGFALFGPWIIALVTTRLLPGNAAVLGHTWNPSHLGETLGLQVLGALEFHVVALIYLALFAMPLMVVAAFNWYRRPCGCWKRRTLWSLPIFAIVAVLTFGRPPHRMPYLGNVLYDTGLGPLTLRGTMAGNVAPSVGTWGGGWWIPTLLGLVGTVWLIVATFAWLRSALDAPEEREDPTRRRHQFFLGMWGVLMVLALFHPWLPVRFDRYLLGAFLPVLVLVAMTLGSTSARSRAIQVLGVFALLAFSMVAQHDCMTWNRARWEGLNQLMDSGVAPEAIDGGYEFNGWYTSGHYIDALGPEAFFHSGPKGGWVVDDAYAISWRVRPGYRIRKELPYETWLGGGQTLLVLERE